MLQILLAMMEITFHNMDRGQPITYHGEKIWECFFCELLPSGMPLEDSKIG